MKAMVYAEYGSAEVLHLKEVAKPTAGEREVLVKIEAAGVNRSDWHLLQGEPFFVRPSTGLLRPKQQILGADIAGRVEAVGRNVTQFKPGDAVFGDLSANGRGGFAQYAAVPETALAPKPADLDFEAAAAVPMTGVTALQGLRDHGRVQAGQRVLINGASGGVGTLAVQIAKAFGAEVTGVASTAKLELVRAIGADHVVDYTREDFTQKGQRYDLIFDTVGNRSAADYRRALTPGGTYVTTAFLPAVVVLGPWLSLTGGQKLVNMMAQPKQADLMFMAELLGDGRVVPVIDRCYPLRDVPEALSYVGQGHAKGKVLITP